MGKNRKKKGSPTGGHSSTNKSLKKGVAEQNPLVLTKASTEEQQQEVIPPKAERMSGPECQSIQKTIDCSDVVATTVSESLINGQCHISTPGFESCILIQEPERQPRQKHQRQYQGQPQQQQVKMSTNIRSTLFAKVPQLKQLELGEGKVFEWALDPKRFLTYQKPWNPREFAHNMCTNYSSFKLAHESLGDVGTVDFISDADNIKRIMKMPLSSKFETFVLHRVGNTVLIDKFDYIQFCNRPINHDWPWFAQFVEKIIGKKYMDKWTREGRSLFELQNNESLHRLFLECLQEDLELKNFHDAASDNTSTSTPFPAAPKIPILNDINFLQKVDFRLDDYSMILGSNVPVVNITDTKGVNHNSVTLQVNDTINEKKPTSAHAMDIYLDHLILGVNETLLAQREDLVVKTCDWITTKSLKSEFKEITSFEKGLQLLKFFKENVVKPGHTYWFYKAPELCHSYQNGTLYDISNIIENEDATEENPLSVCYASLLYNMCLHLRSDLSISTATAMLRHVVHLLPNEYKEVVLASCIMIADLHLSDIDILHPKLTFVAADKRKINFDHFWVNALDSGNENEEDDLQNLIALKILDGEFSQEDLKEIEVIETLTEFKKLEANEFISFSTDIWPTKIVVPQILLDKLLLKRQSRIYRPDIISFCLSSSQDKEIKPVENKANNKRFSFTRKFVCDQKKLIVNQRGASEVSEWLVLITVKQLITILLFGINLMDATTTSKENNTPTLQELLYEKLALLMLCLAGHDYDNQYIYPLRYYAATMAFSFITQTKLATRDNISSVALLFKGQIILSAMLVKGESKNFLFNKMDWNVFEDSMETLPGDFGQIYRSHLMHHMSSSRGESIGIPKSSVFSAALEYFTNALVLQRKGTLSVQEFVITTICKWSTKLMTFYKEYRECSELGTILEQEQNDILTTVEDTLQYLETAVVIMKDLQTPECDVEKSLLETIQQFDDCIAIFMDISDGDACRFHKIFWNTSTQCFLAATYLHEQSPKMTDFNMVESQCCAALSVLRKSEILTTERIIHTTERIRQQQMAEIEVRRGIIYRFKAKLLGWIPCSEYLPDDDYLISVRTGRKNAQEYIIKNVTSIAEIILKNRSVNNNNTNNATSQLNDTNRCKMSLAVVYAKKALSNAVAMYKQLEDYRKSTIYLLKALDCVRRSL